MHLSAVAGGRGTILTAAAIVNGVLRPAADRIATAGRGFYQGGWARNIAFSQPRRVK